MSTITWSVDLQNTIRQLKKDYLSIDAIKRTSSVTKAEKAAIQQVFQKEREVVKKTDIADTYWDY